MSLVPADPESAESWERGFVWLPVLISCELTLSLNVGTKEATVQQSSQHSIPVNVCLVLSLCHEITRLRPDGQKEHRALAAEFQTFLPASLRFMKKQRMI